MGNYNLVANPQMDVAVPMEERKITMVRFEILKNNIFITSNKVYGKEGRELMLHWSQSGIQGRKRGNAMKSKQDM